MSHKIVLALVALLAGNVQAVGGFEVIGLPINLQDVSVNARAQGMGGAFSGVLEGPEAALWNPAVPLEGHSIAVGWNGVSEREFLQDHNRWSGQLSVEKYGVRLSTIRSRSSLGPLLIRTPYLPEGTGESFSMHDTVDLVAVSGDLTSLFLPGSSGLVTGGFGVRRTWSLSVNSFNGSESRHEREFIGLDFGLSVGRSRRYGDGDVTLGWRVSAAMVNGVRPYVDDSVAPESNLRLGGAWSIGVGGDGRGAHTFGMLLAYDWMRVYTDREPDRNWEQRMGAEINIWKRFSARVGFVDHGTNRLVADSAWGLGLDFDDLSDRWSLRLDYARVWFQESYYRSSEAQNILGVSVSLTP